MKICLKCKLEKKEVEFAKCKSRGDGLQGSCKECKKAETRAYHNKNLEKLRAKGKIYR